MAFLPLITVRPALVTMVADALSRQNAVVRRLLNYYEDTWLDGDIPPYSRHDNEQRHRRLAQSSEQSDQLLAPEHIPAADGTKDGAGGNRLDGGTGGHRSSTTTATTEVPRPGQETRQTARRISKRTDDDGRLLECTRTFSSSLVVRQTDCDKSLSWILYVSLHLFGDVMYLVHTTRNIWCRYEMWMQDGRRKH